MAVTTGTDSKAGLGHGLLRARAGVVQSGNG